MSLNHSITIKLRLVGAVGALICLTSNLVAQDSPGRWYLGLDTGVALQQDLTLEGAGETKLSFDPGFRLDLSGGYQFSRSWKAEVELGFIYNSLDESGNFGSEDSSYCQVPMMVNGIYTLPLKGPFSAYAGAGLGGVYSVLWYHLLDAEVSYTFGYQGLLGVKYALKEDLDLGVSYKLLGTLEHDLGLYRSEGTFSHSFLAALTFKF
jgi:opacity protein-like surface antigen